MNIDYTKVFVIRELSTGKLIKFGSKCAWATSYAAKNAFGLHMKSTYRSYNEDSKGLFDSQGDYYLEEIK